MKPNQAIRMFFDCSTIYLFFDKNNNGKNVRREKHSETSKERP